MGVATAILPTATLFICRSLENFEEADVFADPMLSVCLCTAIIGYPTLVVVFFGQDDGGLIGK